MGSEVAAYRFTISSTSTADWLKATSAAIPALFAGNHTSNEFAFRYLASGDRVIVMSNPLPSSSLMLILAWSDSIFVIPGRAWRLAEMSVFTVISSVSSGGQAGIKPVLNHKPLGYLVRASYAISTLNHEAEGSPMVRSASPTFAT